jgi:hypothetical protein
MSVDMLKQRTAIHTNTDAKIIYPEIKAAEDLYIEPILGSALYNKIINDINVSGSPQGASYITLVNNYVLDVLQNYTLSTLCLVASFQLWNKGLLRKTGDDMEAPTMSDLVDISNFYKNRAEVYGTRLTRYLQQNASSTVLPEYLDPGTGIDTIVPNNDSYTIPIFLGDSDDKDCFQIPLTPTS